MVGEKVFFRKRFFGGFNRDDVIKYIAKIAEERNEAVVAKEKAEKDAQILAAELKKLREESIAPVSEVFDVCNEECVGVDEQPTEEVISADLGDVSDFNSVSYENEPDDINDLPEQNEISNVMEIEGTSNIANLDDDIAAIKEIGLIKNDVVSFNPPLEVEPVEEVPSILSEESATEEVKSPARIKIKRRKTQ